METPGKAGLWGTPIQCRAPNLWGVAPTASRLQVLTYGVGSHPSFPSPSSGECCEGCIWAPGTPKVGHL